MKGSYEPADFILCHPRTYWIDPQKLVLINVYNIYIANTLDSYGDNSHNEIWDNHRAEMHAMQQVFLMLDRTYVQQGLHGTEIKSLWKMGIYLLNKHACIHYQIIL